MSVDTPITRWLLGVEAIPTGSQGLELSWQHPVEAWMWLLFAAGAIVVGWWSYRSMVVGFTQRVVLGVIRATLVMLLVALAAGPLLRLPFTESEPDWVMVLVDRSRSMSIEDTRDASGIPRSRDRAARRVMGDGVWERIAASKEIVWLGFHASTFDMKAEAPPAADGWTTDLTVPLESALRRLAGRPASAIVVVSDGRTTRPIDREVIQAAQARALPVFVVPVGSPDPVSDLSITEVDAAARAFIRDHVPVIARVECAGGAPAHPIEVELVESESGRVIDATTLSPSELVSGQAEAVLRGASELEGSARWTVRVRGSSDDLVRGNDERSLEIEFVDRPLRVLYIEGYPRWEYRYLKNLLVREPSLECSVMLLSADRDFAQEGNAPLERLPQTAEEFTAFDLFIIGDVPGSSLAQTQIEHIATAVNERGAGLLWIAGDRSTPGSWRGTSLEDLLPIRGSPERVDEAVFVEPTMASRRGGVLQLGESSHESWPSALTAGGDHAALEWSLHIEPDALKPATEVLATVQGRSQEEPTPLIVSMRYGAGLIVLVGTDETWRWRYGVGETFQERFWIQFIRYLARGSVQRDDRPFRLITEPRRPEAGTPAIVRVEVQDAKAGDIAGDAPLEARAEPIETRGVTSGETIQLVRGGAQWVGGWTPDTPGAWRVRIDSPRTGVLEQIVEVVRSDGELLDPKTDHPQLADLATRTGGAVITPGELSRLESLLPRRALVKERAIVDPIWNSPAALLLVMILLLAEWIGRRVLRLA